VRERDIVFGPQLPQTSWPWACCSARAIATGLFDRPTTDPARIAQLNSPAHQALALRAAEEGIVLLINRPAPHDDPAGAPLLPLDKAAVKKIAVVGPNGVHAACLASPSCLQQPVPSGWIDDELCWPRR
jgi:beta-glucosidase-like glycosyl hydrolase